MSKRISILVPVFNAAPWLPACIDSILNQTEKDWELILVDDFSTDESRQILDNYALRDTRIKVYPNNEKGIIPALRMALARSNAPLITRMDADDIMMPNKLELLKKGLLKRGKGHLSVGLVQYFSDEELKEGYRKYAQWLNTLTMSGQNFNDIYKECVIPSPCWMVYREDLIKCGAFDPNVYPEDYDLCFRFYEHKLKIVVCEEILHQWRDHPARTSRTHEHYADQHFFDLKLSYFLNLDFYHSRKIVIWGAGKTGKSIAKKLYNLRKTFIWVCNNPNKWNKDIMGITLKNYRVLPTLWQPQILICVSSPQGKKEIQAFLDLHGYEKNYHYFYFV